MQTHLSSGCKGPITQARAWWPRCEKRVRRTVEEVEIRMDLVQRIRHEIAAGTYDTQEKWEAALDRLFDRLENE